MPTQCSNRETTTSHSRSPQRSPRVDIYYLCGVQLHRKSPPDVLLSCDACSCTCCYKRVYPPALCLWRCACGAVPVALCLWRFRLRYTRSSKSQLSSSDFSLVRSWTGPLAYILRGGHTAYWDNAGPGRSPSYTPRGQSPKVPGLVKGLVPRSGPAARRSWSR